AVRALPAHRRQHQPLRRRPRPLHRAPSGRGAGRPRLVRRRPRPRCAFPLHRPPSDTRKGEEPGVPVAARRLFVMSDDDRRVTESGIELDAVYRPRDIDYDRLGDPGRFPYARGVRATGYRERSWTIRQYSGFGSATETNRRFRYLIEHGSTGLSTAFDLPTQMGYDSDHPRAAGEVGKAGVAIDSLEDMERLLDGIPLDKVTTSMTINATAAILLLLYQLVAEDQGVDPAKLGGTIQNDLLKEYIARGTYIYPPRPSMRIITDVFAYCNQHLPQWNTI